MSATRTINKNNLLALSYIEAKLFGEEDTIAAIEESVDVKDLLKAVTEVTLLISMTAAEFTTVEDLSEAETNRRFFDLVRDTMLDHH